MGFWWPDKCVGYYSPVPEATTEEHIFYYEALCVLSAIHYVMDSLCVPPTSKILIYTDNDNKHITMPPPLQPYPNRRS